MTELDEALARARAGDSAGMEVLYDAFAGPLHGYLLGQVRRREDAEDLVGQVFLEAIRDLARFEGDAAGFRAWLFRIARNRAVDLGRKLGRRAEIPLESLLEQPAVDDPALETMDRLQATTLWRAVDELPDQQREVVILRLRAGLTATEIAEVVGKRRGAVKALQHRALTNLAKALGAGADGAVRDNPGAQGAGDGHHPYPDGSVARSKGDAGLEPSTGGETRS